jgi:YihY family inner membrane protein
MRTHRDQPTLEITRLILKESFQSFQSNSNFEVSAALATYGFFAFLPLLFFLGYLFGNFPIFSKKLAHGIDHLILLMFPRTERLITQDLYFFTPHKVAWAVIGLFLVVVSVMSLTGTLRSAFSRIFRVFPNTSLIKTHMANLRAALIMVLLFILLILGGILFLHFVGNFFNAGSTFSEMIPAFAGAVLFMLVLYNTFLPVRLDSRQLLIASLLSAGLIVAMREIFSAFLRYNPGFGEAFGALKTLFIMVTWVYYCFLVILFGAELMVNLGKKEALLLKHLFLNQEDSSKNVGQWMSRFVQEYDAGTVLFKQGEMGDRMFYLLSGSVRVMGDQGILRIMKQGEYFGEMSMLLDSPRTATVTVAEEGARLIVLSRKNFELILRDNPEIVFSILKEMTSRLKDTTNRGL